MQKSNLQYSELLIILTVIKVWIFWGISTNYDYLQLPTTEASLLIRLYQPRIAHSGGYQ
ncbi:MAG: hypothetical protein WBA13_11990 [Microcoleaceae cyanobacterium]